MNRQSVLGQKVEQGLQIEIELKSEVKNCKLIFIPVRPKRSNIPF